MIGHLEILTPSVPRHVSYSFWLLFGDFIQLQKLIYGLR
ncbi:hypothetical protein E2C01_083114 [Portunus trituberculatus]|uniref:Uncharacterized protein n=1 Tax=Portunus trituberculatus TaxID=210409 RepID=A0A5B7J2L1_PORTR|nr:hypothetical protein [Portunus trituberculatus]